MVRLMAATGAMLVAAMAGLGDARAGNGSGSGTLRLSGTVPAVCSVEVTDAAAALNLVAGETNRQVGTVVENCNSETGYQVTLSSASRGKLTGAGGTGVAYSVSYGDGATGAGLGQPVSLARPGAAFGQRQALSVSVPASPALAAGEYQDLLTITIAAK